MAAAPTIYILHGDDEVGIQEFIQAAREKMGEPSAADMNLTRFSGRVDLTQLKLAAYAVPFLTARRLVVLENGTGQIRARAEQEAFLEFLEGMPESTAFILVESNPLKPGNWLLKWAGSLPEKTLVRSMPLPRGGALVRRVLDLVRRLGGEMTPQAAQHLVGLVGDDNRLAASETEKLLAYVNYRRPVEVDDVELLTAEIRQGDVFAMVDALGARDGRLALSLVQDLLAERDAISLLGMVIRQFRLLLLYKDLAAQGLAPGAVARSLGVPDFVVGKIAAQARNFDTPALEAIYRDLGEIDHGIKTGRIEAALALETFVAAVTSGSGLASASLV